MTTLRTLLREHGGFRPYRTRPAALAQLQALRPGDRCVLTPEPGEAHHTLYTWAKKHLTALPGTYRLRDRKGEVTVWRLD